MIESSQGVGQASTSFLDLSIFGPEENLNKLFGSSRRILDRLAREDNPELYAEGLLYAAQHMERGGKLEGAAALYSLLSGTIQGSPLQVPATLQEKAKQHLAALTGIGATWGDRFESFGRSVVKDTFSPTLAIPMLLAPLSFGIGRNLALEKIIPIARFFGIGKQSAMVMAGIAGFGIETGVFTTLTRGIAALWNQTPLPTEEEWRTEGLSNAFFLAPIKGAMLMRKNIAAGLKPTIRSVALGQGALLGAVLTGHGLQQLAGLMPERSLDEHFALGIATVLHLNISAAAIQRFGGKFFAAWNQRLDKQAEQLTNPRALAFYHNPIFAPALMMVGAGGPGGFGGGDGPPGKPKPPHSVSDSVTKVQPLVPPRISDSVTKVQPLVPPPQAYRPPSPPPDPYIGQTLVERYYVEKQLGEGGMGTVYRCQHLQLEKTVAMKVLKPELASDPDLIERFKLEAKAASKIGSKHIVEIYDIGQLPNGDVYIIMEYLQGQNLWEAMQDMTVQPPVQRPLPLPRLLHIGQQLAEGLDSAHRAGIVHRDLKPENVFLVNRPGVRERDSIKDEVKILDFGVAKMPTVLDPVASARGPVQGPIPSIKLTALGAIFGSPPYMAPEQAEGKPVDRRADIYSFGAMLHEMATGKWPFEVSQYQNQTAMWNELMNKHIHSPPPPLRIVNPRPGDNPAAVEALEKLILRSLEKDPAKRYDNMKEVLDELDRIQETHFPKIPSTPPPRAPRWQLAAGIGVTGGLGVVAAAILLASNSKKKKTEEEDGGPPKAVESQPVVIPSGSPELVKVNVKLKVEPEDAHIFLDDTDLGSKTSIPVVKGSPVTVEVRRNGFKTKQVILDGSQEEVTVYLERDPKAPRIPIPKSSGSGKLTPKPKNSNEPVDPWK